jgi:hypothetical protein
VISNQFAKLVLFIDHGFFYLVGFGISVLPADFSSFSGSV